MICVATIVLLDLASRCRVCGALAGPRSGKAIDASSTPHDWLRKEIVEHIFGCLKGNDGFRRFLVRGFAKALAQWALACLAFNVRKLHRAWADGLFAWT